MHQTMFNQQRPIFLNPNQTMMTNHQLPILPNRQRQNLPVMQQILPNRLNSPRPLQTMIRPPQPIVLNKVYLDITALMPILANGTRIQLNLTI